METKEQANILKVLGKIFAHKTETDIEIEEKNRIGFIDPANIMMVIPKTTEYLEFIQSSFKLTVGKIPDCVIYANRTYTDKTNKKVFSTNIPGAYFSLLTNLCKYADFVKITVGDEFPIKFETEHFIVLVAPRIED